MSQPKKKHARGAASSARSSPDERAPLASASNEAPRLAPPAPFDLLGAWAFGPIAAVRPYLAIRVVLWMLALDVWSTHLGAAWRYGTAGFNVAHFAWMDALPIPTREAYVAMLALVSVGAAVAAALPHPPRWLLGAVAALYTWGWSSSMHDSYQHHYLISWMLVAFTVASVPSATDLFGPPAEPEHPSWIALGRLARLPHGDIPKTHAWGFRFVTILPAVVYAYTAVSKLEPDWRSGAALRAMTNDGEGMETPLAMLAALGIEDGAAWPALGAATIAIQIAVAAGYLTSPLAELDTAPSHLAIRWRGFGLGMGALFGVLALGVAYAADAWMSIGLLALVALGIAAACARGLAGAPMPALVSGVARGIGTLALIGAVGFHHGAEAMGLEIGWFSYYMIALAIVVLGPPRPLAAIAVLFTALSREAERWLCRPERSPLVLIALGVMGAAALAALGDHARAPGAFETLSALAVVIAGLGVLGMVRPAHRVTAAAAAGAALVVAGLAGISLSRTDERYDYFRFAGGDLRRRGETHEAIAAYREALELAPTEEDHERIAERVRELEALDR